MASMFFYGTLCDLELLEIVLDRPGSEITFFPATLHDHAAYWATTQNYPVIVPEAGTQTQGLYLPDLSEVDIARLDFYESGFVYEPVPVDVETPMGTQRVLIYYCHDRSVVSDRRWELIDWQRDWGKTIRRAIRELMDQFGKVSAGEFDRWYPFCEDRAHSWSLAQDETRPPIEEGAGDRTVDVVEHQRIYTKFYALEEFKLSHRRFDGTMSPVLERALFVNRDAAMVLPYDPVSDRILLIEQFRMGPFGRGDKNPWLYEPIAGMVDLGEAPIETARREAQEEAGLEISRLIPMFDGYPSPGGSTTYFHFFLGECDLPNLDQGTGGLKDEGEDIRVHIMSFSDAFDMVMRGACRFMPLITAILWLAQYRNRDLVS